jgi:hypothetical protein
VTGNEATAHKIGEIEAENFFEACAKLNQGDSNFDSVRLTVWGCRLFDNEAEARKSFG